MIKATICYKDGTEEPKEFRTFHDYGKYIDDNAERISEAMAENIRPTQMRQGKRTT